MRETVLLLYLFVHIAAVGFMPLVTWRTAKNTAWLGTRTLLMLLGFGLSCVTLVWLLHDDIAGFSERTTTLFTIEAMIAGLAGGLITSVAIGQSSRARKP